MTEAGQLQPDDSIWHDGRVWWMADRYSTGEVVVCDAPEHSDQQVRALVLQPDAEVLRAGVVLMDAKGSHMDAVERMGRARRSLDFEMAAQQDRRAVALIELLEAAGVVATYEP